jgi:hypothetical protein
VKNRTFLDVIVLLPLQCVAYLRMSWFAAIMSPFRGTPWSPEVPEEDKSVVMTNKAKLHTSLIRDRGGDDCYDYK